MAWFKHQHRWVPKTQTNTVKDAAGNTIGTLLVEDCACGAVRQIEITPGYPPSILTTHATG